jgi:hypothetical protein
VVRLLVAHAARKLVRQLAREALESLPGDLVRDLPGFAAQAAALRLPLYAAAALGDSEEERAAGYNLAAQTDHMKLHKKVLADMAAATPGAAAKARVALRMILTPSLQAGEAAMHAERERQADAAIAAAATPSVLRAALAQRADLFSDLLNRSEVMFRDTLPATEYTCAQALVHREVTALELKQAEVLVRFALRHNGKPSSNRLEGPSLVLAAAIRELLDEQAVDEQAGAATSSRVAASISPQGVALRCACPGCTNSAAKTCTACRAVGYCSKACQKRDWPAHKRACKCGSTSIPGEIAKLSLSSSTSESGNLSSSTSTTASSTASSSIQREQQRE